MLTLKQIKPLFSFLKNIRPILTHLKVDQDGIKCTDLETSLLIKNNYNLVGYYNYNTIDLKIENKSIDSDDYPTVNFNPSNNRFFEVNLTQLKNLMLHVSKDETRPNLGTIAFIAEDKFLYATDGHTAFRQNVKYENIKEDILITRNSLKILIALLSKYKIKENIKLTFNEGFCYLNNEHFTFKARLLDREYPKIKNIFPVKTTKKFIIKNWIDYKSVKKCLNIHNTVILKLKNGEVILTVILEDDIIFSSVIGICDSELNEEIGYNCGYLNNIIGTRKEVIFRYNNNTTPTIFEHEDNIGLIMPCRL